MNTNLEQVLTETIVSSKKAVGEAVEWALKQAPDVCDQYLKFELISAIINACFIMICLTLVVTAYCKLWQWFGKTMNRDSEIEDRVVARSVAGFFAACAVFGLLCGLEVQVTKAVKIHVAPKVYLVEFATKLVK